MDNPNINLLYQCSICRHEYPTLEECQECVDSHAHEQIVRHVSLELPHSYSELKDYTWETSNVHRQDARQRRIIDTVASLDSGRCPRFETRCLDTPAEVLRAKERLLDAALAWAHKFIEKMRRLQSELEENRQ